MKPLLRWAGSKAKNLPLLRSFWSDQYKRYVEPFAGSACLFFDLEPSKAVLSDLNGQLIETYQTIVSHPQKIANRLSSLENSKETYYEMRRLDLAKLDPVGRAIRFLYLNRYCFNGIWRTNKSGQFNVPYGGLGTGKLPDFKMLKKASSLLKRASITNGDFESTINSATNGDFVYLDPPYRTVSERIFREYNSAEFTQNDLERLKTALHNLERSGAKFVLSYADCPEAKELSLGFRVETVLVRRNVAGFVSRRRQAREVVITNIRK